MNLVRLLLLEITTVLILHKLCEFLGCPTNKTCTCGMVDQFATGMEPKADLSNINGLSLEDGNNVRSWVELWSGDYLNDQCKGNNLS